ncbi:MAG: glycosyltransferase [Patescibacteria group bacterium]|nr:glycosyltransferase [Patescibacteria group bacterium]MCL5431602.1 glycosyltransferase [Patescibacteria group bacterium]
MDIENKPKVSVLLPVYNCEKFVAEAVESIFQQTFSDFEFLIINDGSTDQTLKILHSFADPRLRIYSNKKNLGIVSSLNKGIEIARGQYIVRMDADDVSLPERIEMQVAYMDQNPNIGVCGTWFRTIGEKAGRLKTYPVEPDEVKCALLFGCPIAHPTTILRKTVLDQNHLKYNPTFLQAEDIEFWVRCSKYTQLANIPRVLFQHRVHDAKKSTLNFASLNDYTRRVILSELESLTIKPNMKELEIHLSLGSGGIWETTKWLFKLKLKNNVLKIYPQTAFNRVIRGYWYKTVVNLLG